jgi:hypothetical protein
MQKLMPLFVMTLLSCGSNDSAKANFAAVADTCARVTACVGITMETCGPLVMGQRGFPRLDTVSVASCVKGASDCDAIARCVNGGEVATGCDPLTDTPSCAGSVGRRCIDGAWVGMDCAKLGLTCLQDSTHQLWCGKEGDCTDSSCHKDGTLSCVNDVMAYQPCAGSCSEVDGVKRCVGDGPTCEPSDFRCDGNVAVSCIGGKEYRQSCAVCSDTDGAFCRNGDECSASSCDGATLKACVNGLLFDTDCAALGYTGCSEDAEGAHCS